MSAGEHFVAMGAGDALDAFLREHRVELAARAAVTVRDENRCVAIAVGMDLLAHRRGDALRRVVQLRRQALHVEMRPAVRALQRDDFAGERATGDDQRGGEARHDVYAARAASRVARRVAISALAVSTAIAASRQ